MTYHPLVIKWCCFLASKWNILPLTHWQTNKQYGQTASSSESIKKENLRRMVQDQERKNCKGKVGIHWEEMLIQEGIVVCKRTREPKGFENLDIPKEITDVIEVIQNETGVRYNSETDCSVK